MKIIIDAMGGDNAPEQIVLGAYASAKNGICEIILVGDKDAIADVAKKNDINDIEEVLTIVHASQVITMEDSPLSVIREKNNSSMTVGLKMLANGDGDAFVSAGNTGALHAGSSLIIRRIKGVQRSAIATVLPFTNPTLLLDCGANIELTSMNMKQLGLMGSLYMKLVLEVEKPRVALLNIGTERTKGTKTLTEAYDLLSECDEVNFVGNIEGRDAPYGKCDVIVTDGFSGNVFLKTCEGIAFFVFKQVKKSINTNIFTKIAGLILKKPLYGAKDKFNTSQYGGAPLLGLRKPVIKAHGSSDKTAIENAIKQAVTFINNKVIEEISNSSSMITVEKTDNE